MIKVDVVVIEGSINFSRPSRVEELPEYVKICDLVYLVNPAEMTHEAVELQNFVTNKVGVLG